MARQFNNARFARGFSMGLSSGLPLETAAEFAGQLLSNIPQAARRCGACTQALREGAPVREAMEKGQLLSPAQSRLLSLGIQGGNADSVMENIAGQMMEDAQASVMVLVSSLLVGLILLAVMLPLVDIMSVIG